MISHGPAGSIALDIGANVGAYSLLAGALGKKVLAVEMQPGCIDQIRCHSSQLNHPNLVRILNRFVAATKQHAPVRVPRAECTTMASPSAVVGRWPHGLLTKATRMLNKKHRRSSRILHCSYNQFISPPISSVTFLVSTQSLPKLTQKGSRFKYSSPCVHCGTGPRCCAGAST